MRNFKIFFYYCFKEFVLQKLEFSLKHKILGGPKSFIEGYMFKLSFEQSQVLHFDTHYYHQLLFNDNNNYYISDAVGVGSFLIRASTKLSSSSARIKSYSQIGPSPIYMLSFSLERSNALLIFEKHSEVRQNMLRSVSLFCSFLFSYFYMSLSYKLK